MDVFKNIASKLSPEKLAALARFHVAAKAHRKLRAELNELPVGFLAGSGFDDEFHCLFVLSPFGTRVALAAEDLAEENAA